MIAINGFFFIPFLHFFFYLSPHSVAPPTETSSTAVAQLALVRQDAGSKFFKKESPEGMRTTR
jgi:hypothetical protein